MTHRFIVLHITPTLGFLGAALGITAQPPPKVPRVRLLFAPAPLSLCYEEAFRHDLHPFGYVVGQKLAIGERSATKQGRETDMRTRPWFYFAAAAVGLAVLLAVWPPTRPHAQPGQQVAVDIDNDDIGGVVT